jgi:hypothetical protein
LYPRLNEIFDRQSRHKFSANDWNAGAEILAQGHPVAYREKDTPKGCVVTKYPNGRIELIEVDTLGDNDKVIKIIKDGE